MKHSIIDRLEMRRLLASIMLNDGHVKIDGTAGNDEIAVRRSSDGRISFDLNGHTRWIGFSNLKSISVKSWSGDDTIDVHYSLLKHIDGISLEHRLSSIPFSLDSGKGNDSVEIYALKPVKISLGDGNDQLTSFVQSTVFGGAGDDEIRVAEPIGFRAQVLPPGTERTLSTFNSLVYGNDGNDTIHMIGGRTFGGRGNDVITGAGNLNGEGGNDQITLEYGEAFGGDGHDTLRSTDDDLFFNGIYASFDASEIDSESIGVRASSIPVTRINWRTQMLDGGDGNDTLSAGENAALLGGGGNDLLSYRGVEWTNNQPRGNRFGGSGDDRIVVASGWEFLDTTFGVRTSGDAGDDYVEGRNVEGGSGNDTLIGTEFGDKLSGGDGNDDLFGGAGTDTLSGDAGNDRLYGGWLLRPNRYVSIYNNLGNDIAIGGEGSDFFQSNFDFGATDKAREDR